MKNKKPTAKRSWRTPENYHKNHWFTRECLRFPKPTVPRGVKQPRSCAGQLPLFPETNEEKE